ncbi:MAG: YihY/virulence factor BrkB family protein [Ramlibacter sp.]
MADSSSELEAAEARVAASKAEIVEQVHAMKSRAQRLASSPYVIGSLSIAATAAAYFAVTRIAKPRAHRSRPAAGANMGSVLKTAQLLLPLLGALATIARKRNQRAIEQPRATGNPLVIAPAAPPEFVPHGNWFRQQWQITKAAAQAWVDDYAPSMGAALSYYTLFSLAPLLVIVIAVAGMVFGQEAAQGAIVAQLQGIMGQEGAVAVEGMLKAARHPAQGAVASLVGIALLLLGSTAVFGELQSALDRIWRTPAPKSESGILHLLRTRLLSFGLVLGLGFLLLVSLVVSAALAALGTWWGGWFAGWEAVLEVLNFAVSFGIFTALFAMIYKIMPRATVSWRDVWTGAVVTALLFTFGKVLIGLYLGKSSMASAFGAAGSLVVLIAWVYYSAQIFLFGAEYTWVYARQHGSHAPKTDVGGVLLGPSAASHKTAKE